jgi:hypothetical protein
VFFFAHLNGDEVVFAAFAVFAPMSMSKKLTLTLHLSPPTKALPGSSVVWSNLLACEVVRIAALTDRAAVDCARRTSTQVLPTSSFSGMVVHPHYIGHRNFLRDPASGKKVSCIRGVDDDRLHIIA